MHSAVVRYHEVALKRGNRRYFVGLLKRNLASSVAGLGLKDIQTLEGRLLMVFNGEVNEEEVRRRVGAVFGVANFSFVEETPRDVERIKERVVESVKGRRFESFRVQTKRADKSFPLTSPEVNRQVGAAVKAASGARVDLADGELTISIEILSQHAFFGVDKIRGAGGLPVGGSGRMVSLISGGFDSPVAAYRMMKRGGRLVFVHFHSVPYLDRTSQDKVCQLVQLLTRHQFVSRLYLVPFGEIQREIVAVVPRPLRVVLYRRMMMRMAEAVAKREKAKALVTGESLAQVASQTLQNLAVIQEAARLLVLRPLVGMDKQEIVDQARQIGTFDISAIPDEDCCTLFVPKHPATKARGRDVLNAESLIDIEAMVQAGVENAEFKEFKFP